MTELKLEMKRSVDVGKSYNLDTIKVILNLQRGLDMARDSFAILIEMNPEGMNLKPLMNQMNQIDYLTNIQVELKSIFESKEKEND